MSKGEKKTKGGRWEEISHFDQFGGMKRKKREKKEKEKKMKKSQNKKGKKSDREGKIRKNREEKGKKAEEGKRSEKLYLLSKIYRDQAVSFRRSKMQSSSTRRELCVGTRNWGFCQTPRGRGSLLL